MSLQILQSLIVMKHDICNEIFYDDFFFSPQSRKFILSCLYYQNFQLREVGSALTQ